MDWLGAISSGISSVGNFFGNLFGGNQQLKATREYNKAQADLAKYQNEWNLEMWNRQNDYNSPVSQMQRYQDAGLNPNLIYSQGTPGNATDSPTAATPDMQVEQHGYKGNAISDAVNSALNQYAQSVQNRKAEKEMSLMDTQEDANKANAQKMLAEALYTESRKIEQDLRNEFLPDDYKTTLLQRYQDLRIGYQDLLLKGLDLQFQRESYDDRLASLKHDVNLKYEEWQRAFNDNQYMIQAGYANRLATEMQNLWNLEEMQSEIRSRTDLNYQTASQLHQLTENLVKQGKILDLDQSIKQWEKDFKLSHGTIVEYLKVLPIGEVISGLMDLIPNVNKLTKVVDIVEDGVTQIFDSHGNQKSIRTRRRRTGR